MIIFILLSAIKTHFTDLTTLSSDLTYDGILLFQRIHNFLISKMLKKKKTFNFSLHTKQLKLYPL